MGEQPSRERKIGELCTPDIIDLPILNLVEIGRPFEIKTSTIRMVQHSPFMRKGELPNFRYGQGRPQFNASSSIPNSVPLCIQLKDFMHEQAKINKDTITKFKAIVKVLENIDSKVTEVGSASHGLLNEIKLKEA
jgi:hypothetical protein